VRDQGTRGEATDCLITFLKRPLQIETGERFVSEIVSQVRPTLLSQEFVLFSCRPIFLCIICEETRIPVRIATIFERSTAWGIHLCSFNYIPTIV
jgi:hypothetical protein